jgi:phosphonate transport system permease protein
MSAEVINKLYAERPRSRFVRWSLWLSLVGIGVSWMVGNFGWGELFNERRMANLSRFFEEATPWPLRSGEGTLGSWLVELLRNGGLEAIGITVLLSIASISLAAVFATLTLPFSARNFVRARPLLEDGAKVTRGERVAWRALVALGRGAQVVARAIPEYFYAFFLIGMLGFGVWPAILALAIHNGGILGRLWSEVLENTERNVPEFQRILGGKRLQIMLLGIVPITLPRFLVYLFYRWETCVRDATVLGLLGIPTLGALIMEARAKTRYDEMLFMVFLAALIVVIGDILSGIVRRRLRQI